MGQIAGDRKVADTMSDPSSVSGKQKGCLSRFKRLAFVGFSLLLTIAILLVLEARSSWLQSRWFSALAQEATYTVEEGPNPADRFPGEGPYDLRLGYSRLGEMVQRAQAAGFETVSQARISPGFQALLDRKIFAIYREKDQAGLVLLDSRGMTFLESLHPRRIYASFDSIPSLVRDALLYIENRELLSPRSPTLNPAVEWDRLFRSVGELALNTLGLDRNVPGASTLATQIEKYRHSPEGLTPSPKEKLRQMISASLRAYLDGPSTLERRRDILTQYLNSIPLAAVSGHGEVVGLSDGLWAWYGTDFDEANKLLSIAPDTLDEDGLALRAIIYRQVLGLLLAQRRPSYYLTSGSGQEDLAALTGQYLRRMMNDRTLSPELGRAALKTRILPRVEAPTLPPPEFVERKAQNQIRSNLLSLLGVKQLYDLDRYDLVVETSIDMIMQGVSTRALRRMLDPAFVRDAGFGAAPLLHRGDPSRVIYSLTLSERTPEGNRIRIQTDNFNGPFNISERSRIELGSTAKLRTLVTYLEIVEKLYKELSSLPSDSLEALSVSPQDALGGWALAYLMEHPGTSLKEILTASMERTYPADPRERFATGGGTQVFANFDTTWDQNILTASEGFQHSVNLVWVRVMRDIVKHLMHGSPTSTSNVLEDIDDPARQEYLARFADQEGGIFVDRFYRKYSALSRNSLLSAMVAGRRLNPTRMSWAFRAVAPTASSEELRRFLTTNAFETGLTEGAAEDLYAQTAPEGQTLADLGFLASVHPLELWVVRYIMEHPAAKRAEVLDASRPFRQEVYGWLFRTSRRNAQDIRIRSILEMEAFSEVLQMWKKLGYPFDNIVPSLGTSIGSSGDRPAALAELVGILLNDGLRLPTVRIERLHFAKGTPYEVNLKLKQRQGIRVLSKEVAEVAREALRRVVEEGTGRRILGSLIDGTGAVVPIGGKTGTGDNRYRVFAPGGRMVESRPVNRTSTFVFFLGDRYFGVITAYVPGPEAGEFGFTSSLPLEILRRLLPELRLFDWGASEPI